MNVHVRPMRAEDARAFLEVHRAAIRNIAAADYPAAVIEAWAPLPISLEDIDRFLNNTDHEIRLVAEVEGQVVGLGALVLRNFELRACYVDPQAARAGVGTAIVRELEQIARAHGLPYLELDSSLTAEPFYRALDYVARGRKIHRLDSGHEMASIKMRKDLSDELREGSR